MTHFVGLVVADHEDDLAAILQPYHEYECTGVEDQYVIDVDMTDEARAEFATHTTTAIRDSEGVLHSFFTPQGEWDPRFSQPDPSEAKWHLNARTYYIPPGHEQVEALVSELETFEDWAVDYYGGEIRDGRLVKRTNPSAKWDWWQVGGRWDEMAPGHNCLVEDVPTFFPDWQPSVLVDAEGWHNAKDWGWFGSSAPSDTPNVVTEKMRQHAGKRVWVVDFHI